MHAHPLYRSRHWFAILFLLVGTLGAANTALGFNCRVSTSSDPVISSEMHLDNQEDQGAPAAPITAPVPVPCGAPAIPSMADTDPVGPALSDTPELNMTAEPAPEPDPTPHDRPPLQR